MNTHVAKSFGLAILLAIGVIATMLALGAFSPSKVSAQAVTIDSNTNVPDTPGAVSTITIKFQNPNDLAAGSGQLYVKFDANIGVPSSIEKERITLSASGGGISNPQFDPSITTDVNGDTIITLTVGDTSAATGTQNLVAWDTTSTNANAGHVLQFSPLAGLTNSTLPDFGSAADSNDTWVSMSDDNVTFGTISDIAVYRDLALSVAGGARNTEITLTGKGFAGSGTATVFLDPNSDGIFDSGETVVGSSDAAISGGQFVATFTVDTKFAVGANSVNAIDGGGQGIGLWTATTPRRGPQLFTLTGAVSSSATTAARGASITVSVTDYGGSTAAGTISSITIGGVPATLPSTRTYSNNAGSFAVTIPSSTPLGTQDIRVFDDVESATIGVATTVEVTGLSMTLTPESAVANQALTVSGSGFAGSAALSSITVAGQAVTALTDGTTIANKDTDNSGNLVATFLIPTDETTRTAGTHSVTITDETGRVGAADVTIPARTLTIDPTESRRGSTISFTGDGYQASATVSITYGGAATPSTTVTSDSSGNITGSFLVGTTVGIPSANAVVAAISCTVAGGDNCTQTAGAATHTVPAASVTVTPSSAAPGETITVVGVGFPGFVSLGSLDIATVSALPTPAPSSDVDGNFSATALVPQIGTGSQALLATAGGVTATTSFTVLTAPVVTVVTITPTADVFADVVANEENLVRVFRFSNADQKWSFYDPREAFAAANTLTETSSGDIVWVNVTSEQEFQGQTLVAGWNLISLD